MSTLQLFKHLPTPRTLDAFNFVCDLENPFVADDEEDHSEVLRWRSGDWVLTANSKMVMRQPTNAVRKLTPQQMGRSRGKQPFVSDDAAFAAWVNATFAQRKTTVSDWHSIAADVREHKYFEGTPLSSCSANCLLALKPYGLPFLMGLADLPGILVAEDKHTQTLHFMFDGGQGFVSKQSIWTKA